MHYLALCIIAVIAIIQYRRYIRCSYYQVTKNSPLQVYLDKGKLGEYMTYKYLRGAENNGAKFLFNIYIPKGEEETIAGGYLETNIIKIGIRLYPRDGGAAKRRPSITPSCRTEVISST